MSFIVQFPPTLGFSRSVHTPLSPCLPSQPPPYSHVNISHNSLFISSSFTSPSLKTSSFLLSRLWFSGLSPYTYTHRNKDLGLTDERKMCYLSHWVWDSSLKLIISIAIHFPTNVMISFYGLIKFHCVYTPHKMWLLLLLITHWIP